MSLKFVIPGSGLCTMTNALTFFLLSSIIVAFSVLSITARDPIRSVIFLFAIMFNVAALFVLLDAILISVTLLILYLTISTGLFFCGILIFDLNLYQMRKVEAQYSKLSASVTLILLIELSVWFVAYLFSRLSSIDSPLLSANAFSFSSLHTLAEKLYVDYFYISQGTMLILLVTVIGFVVLTIKKSETLRRDKNILSLEQTHINTDSS